MSVFYASRRALASAALVFAAAPLFALSPSARNEVRMVFSEATHRVVMYGGSTPLDRGTKTAYQLADTWERTGLRWVQRFPAHNPGRRAAHVMIYDSARGRVVLFGGFAGTTNFDDTWVYQNNDWRQLDTPTKPSARFLAGAAYDSVRDRLVLFGGSQYSADGKTTAGAPDTAELG